MKVYRGPKSKDFIDDSHEHVSTITPEQLERSIKDGVFIQFNITKEINQRQSVCTVKFEDIVPMINGLMSKLKEQQNVLSQIQRTLKKGHQSESEQLIEIRKIANNLK